MGFVAFPLEDGAYLLALSNWKKPDWGSAHDVIEKGMKALLGDVLNMNNYLKGYVVIRQGDVVIDSLAGGCMYDVYRRGQLSPNAIAVKSAFLSMGIQVVFKPKDEETELQRDTARFAKYQ